MTFEFSLPVHALARRLAACLMLTTLSACGGITIKADSGPGTGTRNLPATPTGQGAPAPKPPADQAEVAAEGMKLARLLRDQGRFEGAAGIYAQLEQRGSLKPLEMLEYASVAAQVQTPADSLALFGRARRAITESGTSLSAPATATLCNGLGRARMALAQTDAALADFDCTLRADPNNIAALNAKGVLLDARGQHDEARKLLSQALELDPANNRVLNNLALSHLASGDTAQAVRLLSQTDAAQLPTLKLNLAFAQAMQGDEAGARKTLASFMGEEQTAQALAAFGQHRQRIRDGASVAEELLAASRQLLPLRAQEKEQRG
ncbi:MAG: tetratricopeptide repeat protein [Bordetella sp.]|nr:tetratricopeptide repeat protein [Bordetella sp.]